MSYACPGDRGVDLPTRGAGYPAIALEMPVIVAPGGGRCANSSVSPRPDDGNVWR